MGVAMSGASGPDAGSGRLERVLDPSFLLELENRPIEDVRQRRDEALAEREFQSFLRRLVQVREDILKAERERRRSGEDEQPLVERLTAVLSEGPKGTGRGEALRNRLTEEDIAEAERRADSAVAGVNISAADASDDETLQRAIAGLEDAERRISSARTAVIKVHDRLQDELKRRYREDPSLALRGS